ncbi:hypothetical protein [Silvanigrella aquatica]|uniref:Uncharacterized protein n=1 Tax=Silvanigrella aquatica TaxID=1915309 RepID=A0A1L4D1D5_9BACT|nr:hypothetical protein [Silvanigrella aquatica]APJ04006.1 hypothetical protein AXG55_08840 [Silvanigrella aquatica]
MSPSVNAEGVKKSPLDDDVNALLGLHNAITKLARGGMNPKIGGIEVKGENKTSFIADLQKSIAFNFDDPDLPQMKPVAGIKTIAAADSRGGATLLAAIGRTGIMLEQQLSSGINLENLMKNPPVFFSAAALYYAPSSLTVGEFRILFQYMVAGNINETSSYNALPMIPDLKKNPYFTNYKTAPIGQDQKELSELVGWLAASDIAFLAPYISVGMQNWAVTFASLARTMNELNLDIQTKLTNLGENPAAHALGSLFSAISEPNNDGKSLLAYFADRLTEGKDTAAVTALLGNSNAESRDAVKNLFLNLSKDNKVLLPIGKAIATKVGDSKYNYPTSLQNVAKAFEEFKAASQMDIVQKESLQKLMGYIAGVSKQIGVEIAQNANSDIAKKYIKALSDVSNVLTAMQSSPSAMQGLDLATFFADIKKSSASVLASRKAAPGSIIFLHNTQDEVVPYNQSLIAKLAMDSVFESIYKEQEEQTAFVNPLVMSNVPAVGSQFFAFQPDNIFYNIDIGSKNFKGGICLEKDNKGNPASNFSPSAKKCFGGRPLSKLGSGILAHGDAALWTSHLINGSMQKLKYDGSDIEQVHNAMFYGNGMNIPPKKIFTNAEPAELEQIFGMYNTAKNQSEKTMTTINYYVAPKSLEDCNNPAKRTGLCYLVGGSSSVLFNRPLMLDGLQKDLTAGSWNETAQTSAMTPSDVFSAWMDSSVIQVLTSATTKP